MVSYFATAATLLLAGCRLVHANAQLPVVKLTANYQQATSFNATGQYYSFDNIRFAKSPTGDLRWREPVAPDADFSRVYNGSDVTAICPNAFPGWLSVAYPFVGEYLGGRTQFNESSFTIPPPSPPSFPADPGNPEDCLFLDVAVPKGIFDLAHNGTNSSNTGAPVLVWIYGGGYTLGSKVQYGSPAGLIARSQDNGDPGIVYVALNYRLGAFGWLSGPSFQGEGGVANLGLYDQRLALKWVQDNIAKFGGDPKRVTVLGESAGGGSIMHQITAFGGREEVQFQQAVLQSPAFAPILSNHQEEGFYQDFLRLANATSLDELRSLSYEELQTANSLQVQNSSYGMFTYGPVVDGVIAPQTPGQLLAKGQFYRNVTVMTGHNSNEGLLFTPYYIQDDAEFRSQLINLLPTIAAFPDQIDYIMNVLYPPVYDGSQGYTDILGRVDKAVTEGVFTCNTFYLDKAYHNKTYSYEFAVPPGIHGSDISSTFYNGGGVPSVAVALAMQQYITSFALTGNPNGPSEPAFSPYGSNATIQVLNATIGPAVDVTANYRCDYWQKALFV